MSKSVSLLRTGMVSKIRKLLCNSIPLSQYLEEGLSKFETKFCLCSRHRRDATLHTVESLEWVLISYYLDVPAT